MSNLAPAPVVPPKLLKATDYVLIANDLIIITL